MEEKIRIENVTKKFGSYAALDGISLSFEKGKIHGMIGRNGSGKTVLFKCICGFLRVDDGAVFVDGKQIGKEIEAPDTGLSSGLQCQTESAVSRRHPQEDRKKGDRCGHPKSRTGSGSEKACRQVFARHAPASRYCTGDYGGTFPSDSGDCRLTEKSCSFLVNLIVFR